MADAVDRSYLLIGGQRHGQYVKAAGHQFLRMLRHVPIRLAVPFSPIHEQAPVQTDDYRLRQYRSQYGEAIDAYTLEGMTGDEACALLDALRHG